MSITKKTYVTRPFLPPIEEYFDLLKIIWDTRWLTNNGEYHKKLENELAEYLGIENISLFSNGTVALIVALQQLNITGEVITTPYSFVATTHALKWNGLTPVFVDIEKESFNINPALVERAITEKTTAILAVHVYGMPCKMQEMQEIADKYKLKIIYDAAHAFGVKKKGKTILNAGDLSVLSFHATKVFNTFEGGAIISKDNKTKKEIDQLKNFGIIDEVSVLKAGINAKMNELQAAFGILQLKYIDAVIHQRKIRCDLYSNELYGIKGIKTLNIPEDISSNYGYYPILITDDYPKNRDQVYEDLKTQDIFTRRYFYPLISNFPLYRDLPSSKKENLKNANKISEEILCLPIYHDLNLNIIHKICNYLKKN